MAQTPLLSMVGAGDGRIPAVFLFFFFQGFLLCSWPLILLCLSSVFSACVVLSFVILFLVNEVSAVQKKKPTEDFVLSLSLSIIF